MSPSTIVEQALSRDSREAHNRIQEVKMTASTALRPVRSREDGKIASLARAGSNLGEGQGADWDDGVDFGPFDGNETWQPGMVGREAALRRELQIRSGTITTVFGCLPAWIQERVG
jgi:hypothetical protein